LHAQWHRSRRRSQAQARSLGDTGSARPTWTAARPGARDACGIPAPGWQTRLALRARHPWQGTGLGEPGAGAEEQGTHLAGSKGRSAGLLSGQGRRRRLRRAGGTAESAKLKIRIAACMAAILHHASSGSNRVGAGLSGADANHLLDILDKNLAIADLAGTGR